jgi:hypothetical protein
MKRLFLLFVFPFALLTGCAGGIHVVEDARTGGTVALHGNESGAREKAEEHMKARCPGGYEIVEEGEATTPDGDREWRIMYSCKGATGKVARLAF